MDTQNQTSNWKRFIPSIPTKWIIIGIIAIVAIMFYNAYKTSVAYETGIESKNEQMANIRGRVKNILSGMGAAADHYADKVIEAIAKANVSRYGEGGSKAAFQVFVEQNPNLSPEVYLKVQEAIEAQWTDFSNSQTGAIDEAYKYKQYLRSPIMGTFAGLMGFPKIDMKKYEKAVTTKDARKAIDTREDDGVDPFEKKK